MSKKDNGQPVEYNGKTYAYIAAGLICLAAVAIGLSFTVLGIYSLIASVLLSLASLSFVNIQKRKNNFARLKIITVCAYTVLCIGGVIFIGGLIWSAIS
ncbi:MAG: hypothetical protein K2L12_00805 [Clostridia bacterium]|nr:hypothetical protein [Clostridia bacterium]